MARSRRGGVYYSVKQANSYECLLLRNYVLAQVSSRTSRMRGPAGPALRKKSVDRRGWAGYISFEHSPTRVLYDISTCYHELLVKLGLISEISLT